jgi:hypothetical protein
VSSLITLVFENHSVEYTILKRALFLSALLCHKHYKYYAKVLCTITILYTMTSSVETSCFYDSLWLLSCSVRIVECLHMYLERQHACSPTKATIVYNSSNPNITRREEELHVVAQVVSACVCLLSLLCMCVLV